MGVNNGILKEDEFVYYLNCQKASELSPNLKNMLVPLFGIVDGRKEISCEKTVNRIKPDIIIKHRGIEKAVSLKTGSSQVVHGEQIKPFVLFLRSLGVSNRTQQTFLLFLYGDGTMDGTGKERMRFQKIMYWLSDRIEEANKELNSNKDLILKFIDRVVFQGVDPEARSADAIYHGDVNSGVLVTKEQIMKHIMRKDWNKWDMLHIGPIIFAATNRYVGKEIKNEKKRSTIQCYWPHLMADLEFISRNYHYYSSPYNSVL